MDLTDSIVMDPTEAQHHVDELEAHRRHLTVEEEGYLAGYRALAAGRPVVNLVDLIAAGGCFDDDGRVLPRLAVARPFDLWSYVHRGYDGRVGFASSGSGRAWRLELPAGTLRRLSGVEMATWGHRRAMVPPVPLMTRLRFGVRGGGGWRNCLTLFEVGEWASSPRPPGDPALLRPLGGWLYTVEATWDLTDLERAVLAGHRID